MRYFIALSALAVFAVVALVEASNGADVQTALDKYRISTDAWRKLAFTARIRRFVTSNNFPEPVLVEVYEHRIGRDDDQWKLVTKLTANVPVQGRFQEMTNRSETVINRRLLWASAQPQAGSDGPEDIMFAVEVNPEEISKHLNMDLCSVRLLRGVLYGNAKKPLTEIVASSSAKLHEHVSIAGADDLVLIESKGAYGSHQLWLDPKFGFLPRRIEIVKAGRDLLDSKSVDSTPRINKPPIWPSGQLRSYRESLEDIHIQMFEDIPFITRAILRETYNYEHSEDLEFRYELELSDIDFNPEFPPDYFTITTIKVPDGMTGACFSQSQLQYEWRDGTAVPLTNAQLLERLGAAKLGDSGRISGLRQLLIGLNVALIIVLLSLFAIRLLRQRNSG